MRLKKIFLHSFRNIDTAELLPGNRFNVIVGKNAQGKTNLLESIYLLGTLKSFRLTKNPDLIKIGAPSAMIRGWVERDGVTREISISVETSSKKVRLDNKGVSRPSDFFGCLNMIVFCPEDISMIRGLPESRRRYLDRAVFSGDVNYLSIHHKYFKILKNRNTLLKNGTTAGLDVWTERLAEVGAVMIRKRLDYLKEISELLADFYATIAGLPEKAEVGYRSEGVGKGLWLHSLGQLQERLFDALTKKIPEELRKGATLVGPHRDDIELNIDGRILKLHGSQGEQRSFILALKMAEIEFSKKRFGSPPILLLDDMTSELDLERNHNFMEFLEGSDMQVFITTTSTDNLCLSKRGDYTVFPVHGGKILEMR